MLFRILNIFSLFFLASIPFWGKITRVVRCADGDTIIVGNPRRRGRREKIRLIGIDTPESIRSLFQDVMPFGKEATAYTRKRLTKGKRVILIYDKKKRDPFGRKLAYVYLSNGEFFNATLVKRGYAFAKAYPPNLKHQFKFQGMENKARRRRRGLWQIYKSPDELRTRYIHSREYRRFRKVYG